jgi:hypothetical protein
MEKAKTRKEIACEYSITTKTLKVWMDNAGIILESKSLISPKVYKMIKEKFG